MKFEVDGIDYNDFPDFADAYITYAEWNDGTPLTEQELEDLNNDTAFVNQAILDFIF